MTAKINGKIIAKLQLDFRFNLSLDRLHTDLVTSSISVECKPPACRIESGFQITCHGLFIFYFDLDMTSTFMCDLDLINDLVASIQRIHMFKQVKFYRKLDRAVDGFYFDHDMTFSLMCDHDLQ